MARPRASLIDRLLECYRDMEPEERPLAVAALRGFDAATRPVKAAPAEQQAFTELGQRAAEGTDVE